MVQVELIEQWEVSRDYIGPWAPKEDLLWQGNVPLSKKKYNVEKVKK